MRVTRGRDASNTTESDPVNATPASERRPRIATPKVRGEALLAKAVEVLSDIPVRRVTTNEMMGLHGMIKDDNTLDDAPPETVALWSGSCAQWRCGSSADQAA